MRPVTRLSTMIDYLQCLRTSPLNPVCQLRQTGLFLARVCMFLYKSCGVLLVFAWLDIATAGEGAVTVQQDELASTGALNERGGEGHRLNLGNGESPAVRGRTSNRQVHSSQFTPGKNASGVAADRGYRSVNAIGARRVEAAVSIVQREDHHFYVVRKPSSENEDEKTVAADNRSRFVNSRRRFVEAGRVGNLFMDQSLLRKVEKSAKDGQR